MRDTFVLPAHDVDTGIRVDFIFSTTPYERHDRHSPAQLQEYVSLVESGELKLKLGPTFPFEKLREAHTTMDENKGRW